MPASMRLPVNWLGVPYDNLLGRNDAARVRSVEDECDRWEAGEDIETDAVDRSL
jgi:hypothetical protein